MHRAPGTESPFKKGESHWRRSKPAGVTDDDVEEMKPKEEEGELEEAATTEEEGAVDESTNKEWYNGTLSEALIKRYTK